MGRVRPVVEDDIPQVADLHERVFEAGERPVTQGLKSYLAEMLFRNPWYDEALPSLVYEDGQGKIVGFLGVMPRRMSIKGRPVQVAMSHTFMVKPGSRSTLAGVQLLKVFFSGPQDLSIAEGNDLSRNLWEGLGGTTELLYSMCWTRILRPAQYVLSFTERHGLPLAFAHALKPFCRMADAIAVRMPQSPFRQSMPRASGENLKEETLLACLSAFADSWSLRPEYDARSLRWLLERVARKKDCGSFRKVIVRGAGQETLGWYLYYQNAGDVSEVVQIVARDTSINAVLDHLFYDAWRRGVIALSGRLESRFIRELSRKYCLFGCNATWMLVHSRNAELLQAIHRGDAFFTRLEGEWWIGFQEGIWS